MPQFRRRTVLVCHGKITYVIRMITKTASQQLATYTLRTAVTATLSIKWLHVQDTACMLEGYISNSRSFRVVKKCVTDCPLYINTTAEIVRCCTQDNCNEKFRPIPGTRRSHHVMTAHRHSGITGQLVLKLVFRYFP